jgi:hypothetical protein
MMKSTLGRALSDALLERLTARRNLKMVRPVMVCGHTDVARQHMDTNALTRELS